MKIVMWDIETAPMVVTTWGLWEPKLSHDNIIEDTTMICAAWKTYGNSKVSEVHINVAKPRDDFKVVKALRDELASADVIVGHNGDEFDLKILNARIVKHGLQPLPPLKTVDTLKVAKRHFRFSSNRLDYLGELLGVGRKLHTGFELWTRILLKNDKEALAKMVKYNKQDVLLLEAIYTKLRPFMTTHPNHRLTDGEVCPICGAKHSLQKRGFRYTRQQKRQAFQCTSCGGWSQGAQIERTKIL